VPWSQDAGELWACIDPAATVPATVILTASVSDWSPSPFAVAIATATALANQGVPNVGLQTKLTPDFDSTNGGVPHGLVLPVGGSTGLIDIHGQASVLVTAFTLGGSTGLASTMSGSQLIVRQWDQSGTFLIKESFLGAPLDITRRPLTVKLPAIGYYLEIVTTDPSNRAVLTVYGSNRIVEKPELVGQDETLFLSSATGPIAAGTQIILHWSLTYGIYGNANAQNCWFNGGIDVDMSLASVVADFSKPLILVVGWQAPNNTIQYSYRYADQINTTLGPRFIYRDVRIPLGPVILGIYNPTTTATGSTSFSMAVTQAKV
jgi:hypothetical protein